MVDLEAIQNLRDAGNSLKFDEDEALVLSQILK